MVSCQDRVLDKRKRRVKLRISREHQLSADVILKAAKKRSLRGGDQAENAVSKCS
jgi:hypothetical protein